LRYISAAHPKAWDLGLERVRLVAERMNLLDRGDCTFVIVAGTNGKGSTCVSIERILLAHGRSVGCALSPHLHKFNERIRIDGVEAADEEIIRAFAEVERMRGETTLTYFEYATLATLWCFRRAWVDVAILEIGLGGRLDAFNIIDAEIAIITSIGIDHVDYLGDDLDGIGREKAGVMRPGQQVVLGRELPGSVIGEATRLRTHVQALDADIRYSVNGERWSLQIGAENLDDLPVPALPMSNCALASAAAGQIVELDRKTLSGALAEVHMAGRFEKRSARGRSWLLDVAHNPLGAAFLHSELVDKNVAAGGRIVAVYGALRDKDIGGVISVLEELIDDWVLVSTGGPRGLNAADLAQRAGLADVLLCDDLEQAVEAACSLSEQSDVILVFGSFSVVERARLALIS
jgi:dihydrofolate synthase/folylpolyglutamate synthase